MDYTDPDSSGKADDNKDKATAIGTAGIGAALLTVPQAMYRPKSVAKKMVAAETSLENAQAAYDAKAAEVEKPLLHQSKHAKRKAAYQNAKFDYKMAKEDFHDAINSEWEKQISGLPQPRHVELRIAGIEKGREYLKALPKSAERDYAITVSDAQIGALEALNKEPSFSAPYLVQSRAREILDDAKSRLPASPADYAKFKDKHESSLSEVAHDVYTNAEPKLARRVAKVVRPYLTEYNKSVSTYNKTEKKWSSEFKDQVKPEAKEIKNAEKLITKLEHFESANAKSGIFAALKRPYTVLRHGTNKARIGMLASSAAIGAALYVGSRALLMQTEKQPDSFVDREQARNAVTPSVSL